MNEILHSSNMNTIFVTYETPNVPLTIIAYEELSLTSYKLRSQPGDRTQKYSQRLCTITHEQRSRREKEVEEITIDRKSLSSTNLNREIDNLVSDMPLCSRTDISFQFKTF